MAESDESSKVTKEIDYLIVGAGVSGSFCGYQLMNKGIQANKIQIIEKLNRIGGLLKSEIVEIEGYRIKQEEGGMRFHKYHRVYKLAEELGLSDDIVEFKMGGNYNLEYFRGYRFTQDPKDNHIWYKTFNTNQEVTAHVTPNDILKNIFYKIKDLNDKTGKDPFTPEDWQNVRLNWTVPESGIPVPLYKWEFGYLLRRMYLNPETIKMIQYALGFKSSFNQMSTQVSDSNQRHT